MNPDSPLPYALLVVKPNDGSAAYEVNLSNEKQCSQALALAFRNLDASFTLYKKENIHAL
jgi:hypothetical protein|tara:strand:+ start:17510 stop:17689 length:180 start_codon:yes stop_codon:yes gene_type:complete